MKKLFFCIVCLMGCLLSVQAQDAAAADTAVVAPQPLFKFGYLSHDLALRQMPAYLVVRQQMADLRKAYDAEQKRVEDEFNKKYESFLEGQRDFPRTILLKRQNELQELMQKTIAYKDQARREMKKAETDALAPLNERLAQVLAQLAAERGYAFILNTDANATLFVDPLMGDDLFDEVVRRLSEQEQATGDNQPAATAPQQ